MRLRFLIVALPVLCGGCAVLVHGGTQLLTIDTNPQGAHCDLWVNGQVEAAIPATPATVRVKKLRDAVTLVCNKTGYVEVKLQITPARDDSVAGDILSAGIGFIIDDWFNATGTLPPNVTLSLPPLGRPAPNVTYRTVVGH